MKVCQSSTKINFFTVVGFLLLFGALMVQPSCYYDNEEELYGAGCDTVAVKYSTYVKSIMDNQCVGCHSPTGSQSDYLLHDHNAVKNYALNGLLVERMNDVSSPMPPSGLLSDCDRQKIEAWVKAGAPNN